MAASAQRDSGTSSIGTKCGTTKPILVTPSGGAGNFAHRLTLLFDFISGALRLQMHSLLVSYTTSTFSCSQHR